jgi:hypothetical protein
MSWETVALVELSKFFVGVRKVLTLAEFGAWDMVWTTADTVRKRCEVSRVHPPQPLKRREPMT